MNGNLSRRLDRLGDRLLIDPRLGTWDDACWIGRTFGLDPNVVLKEGQRLLAHCDAMGAITGEKQAVEAIREGRLRPTRSAAEIDQAIRSNPHRLSAVVSHCRFECGSQANHRARR